MESSVDSPYPRRAGNGDVLALLDIQMDDCGERLRLLTSIGVEKSRLRL